MLDLLATLLAPLFLAAAEGDRPCAEACARDAIKGLHPTTTADLLDAGQAIGLGLAAIAAIVQSAAPNQTDPQATRLRSQADRLSRSSARCRKNLPHAAPRPARSQPARPDPLPPTPSQTTPSQTTLSQTAPSQIAPSQTTLSQTAPSQIAPSQTARSQTTPTPTAPFRTALSQTASPRTAWADAMRDVAKELASDPDPLAAGQAAALLGAAQMLTQPPPSAPRR